MQPNVSPNLMILSSFGGTFALCFAKSEATRQAADAARTSG